MATAEVLVEVGSAEGNELSVHEKKYHQAQNNKYYSIPLTMQAERLAVFGCLWVKRPLHPLIGLQSP